MREVRAERSWSARRRWWFRAWVLDGVVFAEAVVGDAQVVFLVRPNMVVVERSDFNY